MGKPRVFIGYTHEDSKFVDDLAIRLRASRVDVWIDKWKIKIGDSITQRINEGIGESDFLIIVLSQASAKSKYRGAATATRPVSASVKRTKSAISVEPVGTSTPLKKPEKSIVSDRDRLKYNEKCRILAAI